MDASDPDPLEAAAPKLLCLKCRSVGHIVNDCPLLTWSFEYDWYASPARMGMKFADVSSATQQELCRRCQNLDVLSLLHEEIPWKSARDLDQAAHEGSNLIRSLGMTGSIQFKHDCPLCCCLFAMTPNPKSSAQEVLILPDWTMNRLIGDDAMEIGMEEELQYARCLLITLWPSMPPTTHLSLEAHFGDALCIMEGDDAGYETTLGGRLIDSHSLNTGVVEEWLSMCLRLHGRGCTPVYTENLQGIRLIDVMEPRKIINYPERGCEYVALSYVWGGVAQKSFRLGSTLSKLPQTIEDAIACVRSLGKRYLWVDSVCIDQLDEKEKRDQIGRMSSVYRGAYITLIALSCSSAETGLPRFASRSPFCSQLGCRIGGKRFIGLMPTLSQLIDTSTWGSRAWTLQEALLSPRCLYLSDYQLYFECNVMQCCESLDQTKSWAHNLSCDSQPFQQGRRMAQHGTGCLNTLIDSSKEKLRLWGDTVNTYSHRTMTRDEDALNACSGVLQYLQTKYEDGFFWGLPVADFQWGLLWRALFPPTRREGFPTWSWAGWETPVYPRYPSNIAKPHEFPVHLQIMKMSEGQLVEVFSTPQAAVEGFADLGFPFHSDPVSIAETHKLQCSEFDLSQYPGAEDNGYLFVEAIAIQFVPDYSHPQKNIEEFGEDENFSISIGDTRCWIRIRSFDPETSGSVRHTEQQFLLLARDRSEEWVYHHLLLVHPQGNLVERGTVIQLIVPEDQLEVLHHLKPQKRRVVLA